MNTLTAILLLTTSPGTFDPCPTEEDFPAIRDAVHHVAIALEILDTRETGYIFAKRADFDSDLNLLRRRYQDFKDAPRLAECWKFPDRFRCNELIAFNRGFRCQLSQRRLLERDREELFDAAIAEADQCFRVWDNVRDSQTEFFYTTVRRTALMRLREKLGEEAYQRGELVPPVPVWRWRE